MHTVGGGKDGEVYTDLFYKQPEDIIANHFTSKQQPKNSSTFASQLVCTG